MLVIVVGVEIIFEGVVGGPVVLSEIVLLQEQDVLPLRRGVRIPQRSAVSGESSCEEIILRRVVSSTT